MINFRQHIKDLAIQFFPTGRAFRLLPNGWLTGLVEAMALSENEAYNAALSIQHAILPDNDNFTEDDASEWEVRLGMVSNPLALLEDRKLAIKRKMNHPGDIKARQHHLYIEGQLQAAGFDVYVYENRFPDGGGGYDTQDVFTITGGLGYEGLQHGDVQHGDAQHGGSFSNIIANYIDEVQDSSFYIPSNLRGTFFIGGASLGDYASIDVNRKDEFRQLILKLKPCHMVGYLLINYV